HMNSLHCWVRVFVCSMVLIAAGKAAEAQDVDVRSCDRFAGNTAGAKISACIADLPASGGIADATGLHGGQRITADPFAGVRKPVTLKVAAATYRTEVPVTVPDNVTLWFQEDAQFLTRDRVALTVGGAVRAGIQQIFGGTGTVQMSSKHVEKLYPQW